MKFLIGILTSDDTEKLQRAIQSVEGTIDILVVSNSLDTSYAQKAQKVAEQFGCQFIETESNGTPGRGKQSVLDYFNTTDYDYLIPVDGDDYIFEGGISRIIEIVTENQYDVLSNTGQHMSDGRNIVTDLFTTDLFKYKNWEVSELKSWMKFIKSLKKFELPSSMLRFVCLSKTATNSFRYRDDLKGSEDMYAACEVYQNESLHKQTTEEKLYIYDFDNEGAFWKFYSDKYEIEKTAAALEKLYESRELYFN
jgi:hypothetical protein